MAETKWTQGPWVVWYDGPSLPIVKQENGHEIIGGCTFQDGLCGANAHLIAAAPDLYDALDKLVDRIGDIRGLDMDVLAPDQLRNAQLALAKALGESGENNE